jgi:lipase ATG15
MYPHASIWLTGHSLGGAIASLVAQSNRMPAFTYEAPGDALYASRIGLIPEFSETDPFDRFEYFKSLHIYQFGNTLDPIFLGLCNGPTSSCYYSGYAMESRCHVGKVCIFDTKNATDRKSYERLRSSGIRDGMALAHINKNKNTDQVNTDIVDIRFHRLGYLINTFLEKWDTVPECFVEFGCSDCTNWKYEND